MRYGDFDTDSLMYITNRPDLVFQRRGEGVAATTTRASATWFHPGLGRQLPRPLPAGDPRCASSNQAALLSRARPSTTARWSAGRPAHRQLGVRPGVLRQHRRRGQRRGAIKLARKWGKLNRAAPYEIITFGRPARPRTLATMSASGKRAGTRSTPQVPGFPKPPQRHRVGRGADHRQDRRRDAGAGCRARAA